MNLPSLAVAVSLLNPLVTPETMATTICQPGYTATIRPPRSLIDRYERRYLPRGADPKAYWVDHRIPLALGGNPRPPNLQIQPVAEAKRKDVLERSLHAAVCKGRVPLKAAQERMMEWRP